MESRRVVQVAVVFRITPIILFLVDEVVGIVEIHRAVVGENAEAAGREAVVEVGRACAADRLAGAAGAERVVVDHAVVAG
jgi:hypothetical protein